MPSVFATRFFDVASPRLKQHLGEAVAISRGEFTTTGITASCVREKTEIQAQAGVNTSFADREWLIAKTDYVINGTAVMPSAGDRLIDSSGTIWEVLKQPNMPAFDSYGGDYEWLLRTKMVQRG